MSVAGCWLLNSEMKLAFIRFDGNWDAEMIVTKLLIKVSFCEFLIIVILPWFHAHLLVLELYMDTWYWTLRRDFTFHVPTGEFLCHEEVEVHVMIKTELHWESVDDERVGVFE